MYQYKGKIIRIIDGDSIVVNIDLGFRVSLTIPVRLFGIDTPEMKGESREAGIAARNYLISLIEGKNVTVRTFKDKQEKYGRWLAEVHAEDDQSKSVNLKMIEAGHAVLYPL